MSFNKKSPRNRIPESFRVERLESRVLLSADPVLTPLAMAMLPHAMHVAALPHSADAQQLGFAVQMAMFNAEATSLHQSVLYPTQTVASHAAQGATVTTAPHATATNAASAASSASAFTAAQTATSAASPVASQAAVQAATTSLASEAGRVHILSAPLPNSTTWTGNQTDPTSVGNSLNISLGGPGTLNVTLNTQHSLNLGGTNDYVYAATAGQSLSVVPTGSGSYAVNFPAALPTAAVSTAFQLQDLTLGSAAHPVSSVNFADVVNLTGNLTIYATGTVTFNSAVAIGGNLTIVGAGTVNFASGSSLNTTGNISIQADNIQFPTATNSFIGAGTLALLPTTAMRGIWFASPQTGSSTGTLVIDNTAIASWGTTFTNIAIGAVSGSHADSTNAGPVTIGGTQNFETSSLPTVHGNITFYGSTVNVPVLAVSSGTTYSFYGTGTIGFDAVGNITLSNTVIANAGASNITAYSSGGSITENGASTFVEAANLTATAATGITLPSTQLATLNALNTGATGSINVTQVTQIGSNGALTVLGAAQSNAGAVGDIVISLAAGIPNANPLLATVGGSLTIAGSGVSNAGSGNINLNTLDATSSLTVSDAVSAHAGTITMTSPGLVTIGATTSTTSGNVTLTSSTNSIDINANVLAAGGLLSMSAATDIQMLAGTVVSSLNSAKTGAISLTAGHNDILSTLSAGGTMAVTATAGAISSAMLESTSAAQLNLVGSTALVTLTSARGIGARGADIQTSVSELTLANSVSGDVFVDQTQQGALSLGTGSGNAVTLGGTTGTTSIVTTDGTITVAGPVVFNNTGSVPANVTGNILIQASRAASVSADVDVDANVSTNVGSIEIKAASSINIGSVNVVTITAPATGQTVFLQAVSNIQFAVAASKVAAGADIWLDAVGGNVALGEVATTGAAGVVSIDAGGTITDAQFNSSQSVANVAAAGVRMSGASGIGTSANAVEVVGGAGGVTFSGVSASGGIYVLSLSDMSVGSVRVPSVAVIGPAATPTFTGDAAAQASVSVYGAANLVLESQADLTIASAIGLAGPVSSTSTQVLLEATGELDVAAKIGNIGSGFSTYAGNMSLVGTGGVVIEPAIAISTLGGTLDVEAGVGGSLAADVHMGAASLLSSGSGAVRALATGNVELAEVQTTGNVALTAIGGSITDANGNSDGTAGTLNVTAAGLRLASGTDIGTTLDELQVHVATLTAAAAAGSVYVTDAIAETIGSVAVTVSQVGSTGNATPVVDGAQSGVVTSGANGNVVLQTSAGSLTLANAVSANGSGNVLVQSQAAGVVLNAGVATGTGNVSVLGQGEVDVGTAGVAQTVGSVGATSVDVESATGSVVMTAGSQLNAGGTVRVAAAQSIALASASAANVSLVAGAGSIADANGNLDSNGAAVLNVTATNLRLNAATTVGTATDALRTQVAVASASAGTGAWLLNDQTESVNSVATSVNQVAASGATTVVADAAQVGVVTSTNGRIVVQTTAGNLVIGATNPAVASVNANGTGNVLLQAESGTLDVEARIVSGTGSISLLGATGVAIGTGVGATGVSVATTGTGTLDVESGAAVTMGAGSLLQAAANVGVVAATSIAVATVQSSAAVALTAHGGSITDANGNSDAALTTGSENVIANATRLQATAGIGQTTDALRTQAANVTASAGAGGIYLVSDESVTVSHATIAVNQVAQAGTATATITQALQTGLVTSAGGNVVLEATAGNITLNSGTTPTTLPSIAATGGGGVLVDALAGTVNVNQSIYSNASSVGDGSGSITVLGQTGVAIAIVTGHPTLGTGTGPIDIESAAGSIGMVASALVNSNSGTIRMNAAQNIGVGKLDTSGTAALAAGGDITDADGNLTTASSGIVIDVQATNLRLSAGGSVGTSTDALRTQVATVAGSSSTGTGTGTYLINDQALTVGSVSDIVGEIGLNGASSGNGDTPLLGMQVTGGGNLVLEATTGDVTLTNPILGTAITTVGSGNVLVQALAGNVLVDADIQMGLGSLSLLGSAGVNLGTSHTNATATLDVESSGGSVAMSAGGLLHTTGDIHVAAAQNVGVAQIDTAGDVALTAAAGSITDSNGNVDGTSGVQDVQSNGLRLSAGTAIGTGADALQLQVNTLSESVGAGGAYVVGDQSLAVGTVSASVGKVSLAGATSAVVDTAQAGLASSSNGNLVLQASAGDITLTSASPAVAAINANGSGNILVQSLAGMVDANANVVSGNGSGAGNITVEGETGVDIGATGIVVTVGTGGGTVEVLSDVGGVTMSAHSVLASGNADVRVVAGANVVVGVVESGADVALSSSGGSVLDANGNTNGASGNVLNVQASGLVLHAFQGVGTGTDALYTQIDTVASTVGSQGLFLVNDQTFAVGAVATTSNDVQVDGSVIPMTAGGLTGITAGSGGDIVLQATSGDLAVDDAIAAAGSGNVLLDSVSGTLMIGAGVTDSGSGTGSMSLLGGFGVGVGTGIAITDSNPNPSSVDIESANGGVAMDAGSTVTGSSVRIIAAQDIDLGQVLSSGNVALTATAGTIANATQASSNVQAAGLYLSAGTAAGTGSNALQTQVETLSAAVGNSGMNVVNDQGFATNSVSTTINKVGLDGNTTGVTTATASDAIASSGAVTLEATAGDIALNSANAGVAAVNANGNGNVLVEAVTGSIAVNANVLDGSVNTVGGISLLAAQGVTIGANAPVSIVDGAGAMDIEALGGNIAMGAASALQASVGTVRVVAEGSVALGIVQATGNTLVQAITGSLDVQSGVTVGAGTQTGALTLHGAQDVSVAAGVTVSDGAGAVTITSDLGNVNMATTSRLLSANGTVNVVAAKSVATGLVQATGNTLLQAQGGTLAINNNVSDGAGAQAGTLTLLATGDIVAASGVTLHDGAGRVDIESSDGNVTLAANSALVSDGGTVNVNAALGVTLGQVATDANTRVEAQDGAIVSNGGIVVGSASTTGNLSLIAAGDIDLDANHNVASGAGTLDIEAGGNANVDGLLLSVTGAVLVHAGNGIVVGEVQTGGDVSLAAAAGSITDGFGLVDVVADGVRLQAGNAIGSAATPLELMVNTVTASAGAGGIALTSEQSITVGSVGVSVNRVSTTGTAGTVTDATQAGLVTSANGSISLQTTLGDITLTPAGGNAIAANGSGSVLVDALAASGNVNAFAGITSGTGSIDVEAGDNITLYTANSAAAQLVTALPGLVTVHAINGTVFSGGATAPGQTVNFNTDQLTLQAPLTGTDNQLNIGPSTVASNPDAVVVGGPAAGAGSLYLSQQQIGLIQTGFKDVDIGSTIPGQVVSLVGQDASGNASTNVFVNPLTLTASGTGGTVNISGGLQSTSLDIEGSRTGTTLASATVSTSGAIVVNDNVIVTGATSLTSGTGGAAGLTVNGTITGTGTNSLAMSANGGAIVVTGAVSGLGSLSVTQAASLTFQSTFNVSGNVVINTTGAVDFVGGVTIAAGGTLTINGATSVTFASTADFTQAGAVKISTTVLNFAGGAGSVHGVGNLTLQGPTATAPIHLGSNVVAGSLNINAQDVSAIAQGFQQVVIGTVDASTGHASSTAGAVDIDGSMNLASFAAPLAIYASTITVDAGGTGVHVGGPLVLDAVGQIQVGSNITATVAANVSLTSATGAIQMTAQTTIGTLGGNVTLTTGNSSNATLSVIDTRATGSDVGATVTIDVQNGRVIDANADSSVNVYGAAVSMKGYGITDTPGSSQNSVLKVRAPIVYVASPTGDVVADAGQDGRTNYNALDHGTLYEELISVGATTRVTLPGDAVAGGGSEAPTAGTLDVSLIHAAAADAFMSRLTSATLASADADGVSLDGASSDMAEPSGYVLGSMSGHPSVSGVDSYGDGAVDWWTESLQV